MGKIISTKLFKVMWVAALFVLLLIINPAGFMQPFRNIFVNMMLPFQKVAYSFSIGTENIKDFFVSIGQLKSENEKLLKENRDLIAENASLTDLQNENTILRNQIDLLPRDTFDLESAVVVSQDPNGLGNWMIINKGSDNGIKQGMPVIYSKNILVGKIQDVNPTNSVVMLLTNPKSIINIISSSNEAKGVVRGEYGLGLMLDMVLQTDVIKSGDNIVTSGMGGDIPRGLFVGTLQDVHPSEDHLFQQATINPPLQVSKLQLVFIIRGGKK
jgi:rod shape-determining protein MreC